LLALESLTAIVAILLAQASEILALPFIKLTEVLNWLLLHLTGWFVENNSANIRLPHYSGNFKIVYVLYFVPVILLTIFLYRWKPFAPGGKVQNSKLHLRFACTGFLIFLGFIVFHPFSAPWPDGRLRIDFLDVGQGDSALITMPTGETLLIDAGGRPNFNRLYVKRENEEPEIFEPDTQSIGESVVAAFLWERGYDRIDFILATHADADHMQGLADIARNFQVRSAIFGRTPFQDADFADLYGVLQKRNIPVVMLGRGDTLNFNAVKIETLHPTRDDRPEAASDNNHSIVLKVTFGSREILLTGDIEKETEIELANAPELLQADVVKVAHHGSRTSSTQSFIEAAQAKLAVISVGRQSPFGHPHQEVVERWNKSGAQVLTTGENGTITISTDGNDLQLRTFTGGLNTR
jgi:competence protein ComEC